MKILADENIPQSVIKKLQFLIQSSLIVKLNQSVIVSLVEDQIQVSYI